MTNLPVPVPNPPPRKQMADRPHHWTIGLALVAAIISMASAFFSGLQWWENHRQRNIPRGDRAILRPRAEDELASFGSLEYDKSWFESDVTVRNFGRTLATEVQQGVCVDVFARGCGAIRARVTEWVGG